jgi:molybdopterin-dependent oxidoreductase-like protein protein
MTSAALDRLLAVLVVAMAATGLATLRVGHPSGSWLFVLHGGIAGALALAIAIKLRRSIPRAVSGRRIGRLLLALVVALAVAAALTGGWLWVSAGEIVWIDAGTLGRWTILTLHAWVGLAVVPVLALHVVPRRWRLLRPGVLSVRRARARLLSRRAMLAGSAFAIAGVGAFGLAALVDRLRGGERRFTGSRWLPAGGVPPATTFFGEPAPEVELADWRLRVEGLVARPSTFSLEALRALGTHETSAVLDCTSGWALETGWRGVHVAAVLAIAGAASSAREVEVRSATGWSTVLPIQEAGTCLLAWEVAGQLLPDANGAPVRLVVPDRRGLDWVKWVTVVRVA